MPLTLHWTQIALRLGLAVIASFLIGLNRDEQGHPAGIRTTMLVCLAAALAMVQVNLLLPMTGKTNSSFAVMDLMRLPLGILSGIGFLGAGVILKREHGVVGVTTAATMWFVTVLGLLFGGGQLILGITGSTFGILVLWGLKHLESVLPRKHQADIHLRLGPEAPPEDELRRLLRGGRGQITQWNPTYEPASLLSQLNCQVTWTARASKSPKTPDTLEHLRTLPGVLSIAWDE